MNQLQGAFEQEQNTLHDLARAIFKNDSSHYKPGFIGLLEESILRIEKGNKKEIRFVYERFNKYLFAYHFIRTESTTDCRKLPIPAVAYENVLRSTGHGRSGCALNN